MSNELGKTYSPTEIATKCNWDFTYGTYVE